MAPKGKAARVRKTSSVATQVPDLPMEPEIVPDTFEDLEEETPPPPRVPPGIAIVILRGAQQYTVAGIRFTRDVPVRIDARQASLFRGKGWFEVLG